MNHKSLIYSLVLAFVGMLVGALTLQGYYMFSSSLTTSANYAKNHGRLAQKIALVTGASRGIGAETARLMAKEGAYVIVTDIDDAPGIALAREIGGSYYHLDVSQEEEWKNLVTTLRGKFERIDILFNNAGIIGFNEKLGPQDPEYASLESWQHVHHVNLDGTFLGCKYGIQLMKKKGGSIINMSSRSGLVGIPGAAAYASSKAGVRNHTKSVALYCADKKYNIRCNSLHPGAILTPLWDSMLGQDEITRNKVMSEIAAGVPLGRMGAPQDVAYAVIYLASDEAQYITGMEFNIDGGILAGSTFAPKSVPKRD